MNGTSIAEINIITSTATALITFSIAVSAWRRRYNESALWFVGLVLCACWISCWYVIEAAAGYNVQAYVIGCKFEYIGLTLIPLMWFGFSLSISGHEHPFRHKVLGLLLVIPITTDILAFTNDWHGLIWKLPRFEATPLGPVFAPQYGLWFWVNLVFAYILFFSATFVLTRRMFGAWRLYRTQSIIVLTGAIFPWISNFLDVFDQFNPAPALYSTSICLTIALTALAIGVFRMRLLDITPFTHDTILSHMPVGYLVTDASERIVAFNRHLPFSLDDEDIFGKPLKTVLSLPPMDPKVVQQPFVWHFQDRIVEISITPMLNWRQRSRGNLYVLNDVTTRVQAEKARHESEMRQSALLKALPDLMFRLSRDGIYLDYHAANDDDLIMNPEEFLQRHVTEILPGDVGLQTQTLIDQVLETGDMATYEYSLNIGGRILDFESRIVASGTDETVAITRNITEQRQAKERAFALALEKERVTLLTRFIHDSSHEFRTPLSVIEVNLHLMRKMPDADKRAERADHIQVQVERITHLVDMLVQMSRLDSGVPFRLRSTNANIVVEQVSARLNSALSKKNLRLDCEFADPLPSLQADPTQLLEALTQIVDNSIRYTPTDGGAITVRTEHQDHNIRILVEDSGIGIPEDALPHVFERFFRLDTAHSTPGFGLGLSIAQKIVELHGGTVSVTSQLGIGTTFSICLPCVVEPETAPTLVL